MNFSHNDFETRADASMRPISKMLWNVSRYLVYGSVEKTLPVRNSATIDWSELARCAFRHRLSSALISYCSQARISIPKEAQSVLLARRRDDFFRGNLFRAELQRLMPLLRARTPDIIIFKGLELAEMLYTLPRLRVFTDVDLLVRPEHLDGLIADLKREGYQTEPALTSRQIISEFTKSGSANFRQGSGPLQLDIHTHVTSPSLAPFQLSHEFFGRAREREIAGAIVKVFSPSDRLLVLALHGEKHQWHRLCWVVDMGLALKCASQNDLIEAMKTARKFQIEKTLRLGISLAKSLERYEGARKNVGRHRLSGPLRKRRQEILDEFANPSASTILPPNLKGVTLLRPSLKKRFQYITRRFFEPNASDFRAFSVPDRLFYLYYLIRPARLAKRYTLRLERYLLSHCRLPIGTKILRGLINRFRVRFPLGGYRSQLFGECYARIDTQERVVSLTFDDGPLPPYTEDLLNVLEIHQVKATFFCLGKNLISYPDTSARTLAAGHELGNHSFSHARLYYRTLSFIRNEIEQTDGLLRKMGVTGEILFRAPYGRTFLGVPWILSRSNRKHILFDFFPEPTDWSGETAERVAASVIEKARAGSIIVLHDGNRIAGKQVARITDLVISGLRERGYRFLPVSKLLEYRNGAQNKIQ